MPEDLTPMNRREALLAGEDLEPMNREEWFLKKAGSGGGGGSSAPSFSKNSSRTADSTVSLSIPDEVKTYIKESLPNTDPAEDRQVWIDKHIHIVVDGAEAIATSLTSGNPLNRLDVTTFRPFIDSNGMVYCKHTKRFSITNTGDISVLASTIKDVDGNTITPTSNTFNNINIHVGVI